MTTYTHISDLAKEAQPPEKGILSRTIFNDEKVKAVIFGFGQGEELSEPTASMPATEIGDVSAVELSEHLEKKHGVKIEPAFIPLFKATLRDFEKTNKLRQDAKPIPPKKTTQAM